MVLHGLLTHRSIMSPLQNISGTSEAMGEMFEGDFADICAVIFPLVSILHILEMRPEMGGTLKFDTNMQNVS